MTVDSMAPLCWADLAVALPRAVRMQRLLGHLRAAFACDAVALLQLDGGVLRPVATEGLSRDALGRTFVVAHHPRLAAILLARDVIGFEHESTLPDPYDGLVGAMAGAPLPVHDCMGVSVSVDGQCWGVLTLDALRPGTFTASSQRELRAYEPAVAAAIRMGQLEQEVQALRQVRVGPGNGTHVAVEGLEPGLIGRSVALQAVLHELDVVAQSDLPVLLTGETGVGKDLFARRVHDRSARQRKPYVQVNCAALPETLAESELFGHVRGAFSGATTDRAGRFEAAHGGTLFLDEVGELPLGIQAKLLRALQNGEIQRLGADRPVRVDVRVVAATNRTLKDAVAQGAFRADLFHRLSVYPVPVPPLRERGDDVLLLAGHFLEVNRARLGLRSLRLDPEAEIALLRYPWPGNVRELEHVMGRASLKLLSRGVGRSDIATITVNLLDLEAVGSVSPASGPGAAVGERAPGAALSLREQVDQLQRQAIRQALQGADGQWAHAARLLGIDGSNLHKLARRLGLKGGVNAKFDGPQNPARSASEH